MNQHIEKIYVHHHYIDYKLGFISHKLEIVIIYQYIMQYRCPVMLSKKFRITVQHNQMIMHLRILNYEPVTLTPPGRSQITFLIYQSLPGPGLKVRRLLLLVCKPTHVGESLLLYQIHPD